MGTRKKCEHGIFIGFDDKVKVHRVYIKRTKKILLSQHVQSINSAKTGIDNYLSAVDDRPTFNISDAESIPSQSENRLSISDLEDSRVDINAGEYQSLAERRERRHVTMPARYADGTAMVVVRVKEPRSVK